MKKLACAAAALVVLLSGCTTTDSSGQTLENHQVKINPSMKAHQHWPRLITYNSKTYAKDWVDRAGNGFVHSEAELNATSTSTGGPLGGTLITSEMERICTARGFNWDAASLEPYNQIMNQYVDPKMEYGKFYACHDLRGNGGVDFIYYIAKIPLNHSVVASLTRDHMGRSIGPAITGRFYYSLISVDSPDNVKGDLQDVLQWAYVETTDGPKAASTPLGLAVAWARAKRIVTPGKDCTMAGRHDGTVMRAGTGDTFVQESLKGLAIWSCVPGWEDYKKRGR